MTNELIRQDHNLPDINRLFEMREILDRFLSRDVNRSDPEWLDGFNAVLRFQAEDGSFNLLDSFRVPGDARVDFCYMPTYICTAIIMKALMFDNSTVENTEMLGRALQACCGRRLGGHGYDSISGMLDAVDVFKRAGVREFLLYHPEVCLDFSDMMAEIIDDIMCRAICGDTLGTWGEDHSDMIYSHADHFPYYMVFACGDLMKGGPGLDFYLGGRDRIDSAHLNGHIMLEVGPNPGIIKGKGTVRGELYRIWRDDLVRLDYLKGEGMLYSRKCVPVTMPSGRRILAQTYVCKYDIVKRTRTKPPAGTLHSCRRVSHDAQQADK